MKNKFFLPLILPLLLFSLIALLLPHPTRATPNDYVTLQLYDAASGTIPQPPLMTYANYPINTATPIFSGDSTILDTTENDNINAGWFSDGATAPGFPELVQADGFHVDFTVQIGEEAHGNNNRAGFSVIVLSNEAKGIELAFWMDEIWAQNDTATGGLFTHGESTPYTTTTFVDYQVLIVSNTYTLTANTLPILTGPVRDYSDFVGIIDPYETPNLLFFGDDTTSARARIRIAQASVTGTGIPTPTPTSTDTATPTPTNTLTPTSTPTPIPPTPTPTFTRDLTAAPPTETLTPSPSPSPTPDLLINKIYLPIIKNDPVRSAP